MLMTEFDLIQADMYGSMAGSMGGTTNFFSSKQTQRCKRDRDKLDELGNLSVLE